MGRRNRWHHRNNHYALRRVTHLCQFQERWIDYRTTAEALKKEKFLFVTKTEPYDGDDAFPILVQRMENLVSKENVTWAQYLMKPDKEKAKVSV
jgi:hypothetical protein